MNHKLARLLFIVVAFQSATIAYAEDNANCQKKYDQLNEKYNTLYIDLESQCYPEEFNACTDTLSDDCVAKYDALAVKSTEDYNTLFNDCPDLFMAMSVSDLGAVKKTPTKRELNNKVQELKKKLRAARSKNRTLQASCSR